MVKLLTWNVKRYVKAGKNCTSMNLCFQKSWLKANFTTNSRYLISSGICYCWLDKKPTDCYYKHARLPFTVQIVCTVIAGR